MTGIIQELINACTLLKKEYSIIQHAESTHYINSVISSYRPKKTAGHVAIQSEESDLFQTDLIEFEYSHFLDDEPVFLFFDQTGMEKNFVFKLNHGKNLCEILEECFGIEYFLSNEQKSYLISVNWYTLEVVGDAKSKLKHFKDQSSNNGN